MVSFQTHHVNEIAQYGTFGDWLFLWHRFLEIRRSGRVCQEPAPTQHWVFNPSLVKDPEADATCWLL